MLFQLHANDESFDMVRSTQEFATTMEYFFSRVWNNASHEEQMLILLVALINLEHRIRGPLYHLANNYKSIFSQYERRLRNLEIRGVLIRAVSKGKEGYILVSTLMVAPH